MALDGFWNVEWPNVNTQRKYPLSQSASLTDGDFVIPNDLIVDFVLPVNAGITPPIDPAGFHISQLGIFSNGLVISFAYKDVAFATINVPVDGFVDYTTYTLHGTGLFSDSEGWVTLGTIDKALNYPGAWAFTEDTGKLHPMVIRPDLRSVASVTVINGDDVSAPISGDIALVAGTNFRFRVDLTGDKPQIIFDAIDGSGNDDECDCDDDPSPCIRKISGVSPNAAGELQLLGSTCVSLTAGLNKIAIIDECSAPCCDCRELIIVTSTLDQMLNQMLTLEGVGQKLDEVLTSTRVNLMASRTTGLPRIG